MKEGLSSHSLLGSGLLFSFILDEFYFRRIAMKLKKKKAFTLTELLIVVMVLGVLAAVAIPKFSKVLETQKTTLIG